jgi:hypothetical protein
MLTPGKSHHILLREIARRWELFRLTGYLFGGYSLPQGNAPQPEEAATCRSLAEGGIGTIKQFASPETVPARRRNGPSPALLLRWGRSGRPSQCRSGNNRYRCAAHPLTLTQASDDVNSASDLIRPVPVRSAIVPVSSSPHHRNPVLPLRNEQPAADRMRHADSGGHKRWQKVLGPFP